MRLVKLLAIEMKHHKNELSQNNSRQLKTDKDIITPQWNHVGLYFKHEKIFCFVMWLLNYNFMFN